jgi:hypothetical protein
MTRVGRVLAMGLLVGGMISPGLGHGQMAAPMAERPGVHVEVLTDTGGVNLSAYMRGVVSGLKSHWAAPVGAKETALDLTIGAGGEITAMRVEHPVMDEVSSQAAWNAAKETKFGALPVGMRTLRLRVSFVGE